MLRVICILGIGIAIGYFVGFGDAQTHEKNIIGRTIERVGGSARDRVGNDIDARYDKVGK
jgi:hypothetical protein